MSSKKRAIVRMEGTKYENMKKLEKAHIRERGSVKWSDATIAVGFAEENATAMQERHAQYEALITNLHGDIALIEEQTQNALVQQELAFINQLSSVEYEMNRSTDELLRQQNHTFEYLIQEVQLTYQAELEQVREDFDQFTMQQNEKDQAALHAIEDVDAIFDWIRNSYDWEFFLPNDLIDFERRLDTASENYYSGMPEAALAQAQDIQHDLLKRRLELEQKTAEWSLLRGMVAQRTNELLQVIDENRFIKPVDLEMNVVEGVDLLDTNYWSQDHLSEVEEKLQQIQRSVNHRQCDLTMDELSILWDRLGENVEEKLASVLMYARYNALDAQIRRSLATIAADVMEANGFRVVSHSDDINAIQEPFFILMQDDYGGEISIDISPDEGYINNISIEMSESAPIMDYQLENQRQELIEALNSRGVAVQRLDKPTQARSTNENISAPSSRRRETVILPQSEAHNHHL